MLNFVVRLNDSRFPKKLFQKLIITLMIICIHTTTKTREINNKIIDLRHFKAIRRVMIAVHLELGLCCLTSLSPIFQLYDGGQFYWWRKQEYPEKTCRKSLTNFISHTVVSSTPRLCGVRIHKVTADRH